ncbi:hypothetical protein SAMN04487759_1229 [Kandleria vitulina]|uniref:Uncharacterized protein n=1 Tax=Kandleria vitulina TaxID=1630 RepID=A0A1H2UM31_9FIRM|nr:hypothetical protein [Kandleria vitulina]SDW56649.1 hypothetical protein SAMN04487759_1229 [Kandleria vitulina]
MEKVCPLCGGELKKEYCDHGPFYTCVNEECEYKEDELGKLIKENEREYIYKTPLDDLPPRKRREYMLQMSPRMRVLSVIEAILLLLTIISLFIDSFLFAVISVSLLVIIAIFMARDFLSMKRLLSATKEEQDDYIIDRMNDEFQKEMIKDQYLKSHPSKTDVSSFYIKRKFFFYLLRLKRKGLPYRFMTDPIFSDQIMTKVRKETDMDYKILIQDKKNELNSLYYKRFDLLEELEEKHFKDYGHDVRINFHNGEVRIGDERMKSKDIKKVNMVNNVYDDEIVMQGDEQLAYSYKHGADLTRIPVKMCDHMEIVVETNNKTHHIVLLDHSLAMKSPEYSSYSNDCYNVTGGLRRAMRTPPSDDHSLEESPEVLALDKEMEEKQEELRTLLIEKPVYKVPDCYKMKE